MDSKQHQRVDKAIFGQKFPNVHKWLEVFYTQHVGGNPFKHWLERHHLDAIHKEFGKNGMRAQSAIFHVLCDWYSHFGVLAIPKDKEECEQLLKDAGVLK